MDRIKVNYPVIVEGKYDKIKLSSVIDADIFITDGFGVFKKNEKSALFRMLSEKSKIIVLTDSDGGGRVIRNFFNSVVDKDRLIHLYIPRVQGKEKRKTQPSKEGFLGVEGIDIETLYGLFLPFSADASDEVFVRGGITKADLYELGICGKLESAVKRAAVSEHFGFPSDMSANALLSAINILYSREKFIKECQIFLKWSD